MILPRDTAEIERVRLLITNAHTHEVRLLSLHAHKRAHTHTPTHTLSVHLFYTLIDLLPVSFTHAVLSYFQHSQKRTGHAS